MIGEGGVVGTLVRFNLGFVTIPPRCLIIGEGRGIGGLLSILSACFIGGCGVIIGRGNVLDLGLRGGGGGGGGNSSCK